MSEARASRKRVAVGGVIVLGVGAAAVGIAGVLDGATSARELAAATPPAAVFAESKDVPLTDAVLSTTDARALYPTVSRAERAALLDGSGVTFTVSVDGEVVEVETAAETFAEALAHAGIEIGWDDDVAIDLSAPPVDGAEVRIGRVTTEAVTESVVTPHETQQRESKSLDVGKTRVIQEGVDGQADVTSAVRYVDGVEASRTTLVTAVLAEPVTEIVEIGTRKPASVAASQPASGGSSSGSGSSDGSGSSGSGSSDDGESAGGSGGASSTSALYTLRQFKSAGIINWEGYKFTYYSQSVLPGGGLKIPGRHVNEGGYVADGDGYIVLANDSPKGTVINTPFGYQGKVYDRGTYGNHYDVYIK